MMWIARLAMFIPVVVVLAACAPSGESRRAPLVQSGADLYQAHCATCHGPQARGDGPTASTLAIPVPDLTRIAARSGGKFPAEKVFRIIDGQWQIPAHGARPMPLWGYEFFGDEGDDESEHREATRKIDSLVTYLASLQRR